MATSVLAKGGTVQIYKPWIVQLPGTAELLIVAFCPMGFGPGQCTFRNGTASEHAIFWRSSDSGASWSREGEDRVDVRGRRPHPRADQGPHRSRAPQRFVWTAGRSVATQDS